MQFAFSRSGKRRRLLSEDAYVAIDRDYAAIRRSHFTLFEGSSRRPSAAELAEYHATVHRNADGTIDFDAYRKRAAQIRNRELVDGTFLGLVCASLLTLCLACAVMFVIASHTKPPVRGDVPVIILNQP